MFPEGSRSVRPLPVALGATNLIVLLHVCIFAAATKQVLQESPEETSLPPQTLQESGGRIRGLEKPQLKSIVVPMPQKLLSVKLKLTIELQLKGVAVAVEKKELPVPWVVAALLIMATALLIKIEPVTFNLAAVLAVIIEVPVLPTNLHPITSVVELVLSMQIPGLFSKTHSCTTTVLPIWLLMAGNDELVKPLKVQFRTIAELFPWKLIVARFIGPALKVNPSTTNPGQFLTTKADVVPPSKKVTVCPPEERMTRLAIVFPNIKLPSSVMTFP